MRKANELRENLRAKLARLRELNSTETLTRSQQTEFDRITAEAEAIKEELRTLDQGEIHATLGSGFEGQQRAEDKEQRAAFNAYLRGGVNAVPAEQRSLLTRDMTSGGGGAFAGSGSGYFVPVGFVQKITEAMKFVGPMTDFNTTSLMDSATGGQLPFPTDNDTDNVGELVGEGQQVSTQDVEIGQILMGSYKYSTKMVKISLELLQDSAFDLESWLIRKFAIRLGRILNQHFTTGTGTGQPLGVMTAALAHGALVPGVGSSANTGGSEGPATSIGTDDLYNALHALDPLLRPGAKFMCADSTLKYLKQLKDKFGHPLLQPAISEEAPARFDGREILINPFMDELFSHVNSPPQTRNVLLCGNFKNYQIRRVRDMSVLRLEERFADYGQVAFLAFARFDATVLAGTNASGSIYPFSVVQAIG